jgi:hypothetical protein
VGREDSGSALSECLTETNHLDGETVRPGLTIAVALLFRKMSCGPERQRVFRGNTARKRAG